MFTSHPQRVEVFRAGVWRAGELLGWRHDEAGVCQVWVRVVAAGVEETGWTDLAALRLPERPPVAAAAPVTAAVEETRTWAAVQAAPHRGVPGPDVEATASLPLVRDHVAQAGAARPGGRRRAPEESAGQAVAAAPRPTQAPGRHRAPASPVDAAAGRHRAADTGLIPVVAEPAAAAAVVSREEPPATVVRSVPTARGPLSSEPSAPRGWSAPAGLEGDLLTRPMRLSDQIPQSRRPRVDGSLSRP
ncbi:hypothetical protein BD833_11637 [Blastococcus xanthinilyticus]|uniref:Uncharacterized protein n=1 Tax=Blastococcus xanthinilyticus TaxID=1564164 RepID=A0A5S5CNI4_9ACTN|nr:hypothetical protein BD833_11637 [Blastococcus xanthinilyticus]